MSKITNDGLTQLSRTHSHYARCRTLTRDNARWRASTCVSTHIHVRTKRRNRVGFE